MISRYPLRVKECVHVVRYGTYSIITIGTCHVYIDAFKNGSRINPVASGILSKPKTCEDDILDSAFGVQPNSRLACQATLLPPAASADITVKVVVPKSSKNISRSDFKSKKSKTK